MVKHYSKRASKKRAYKKRRTVKKSKNATRRRKIQNGGSGDGLLGLIGMIVMVIVAAVGGDKLLKFLKIISLFTGGTGAQGGGGVQTGGWEFPFAGIKDAAAAGAAAAVEKGRAAAEKGRAAAVELKTKAMNSDAAGSLQVIGRNVMSKMPGATPTATPANDSAPPPPGKLKSTLIAKLTELKTDLVNEKNPKGNGAALRCLDQIIGKLNAGTINVESPVDIQQKPESPGDITETIKTKITAKYEELKNNGNPLLDNIKQGSQIALKEVQGSINVKIGKLLDYIKRKYRLTDEDMECFVTLKNLLVGNLTRKLDAAMQKVKDSTPYKAVLRGVSGFKGMLGNFFGSGTTPDLQATGTAVTLQSRNNAETDAKTKREVAFNAATNARNKRTTVNANANASAEDKKKRDALAEKYKGTMVPDQDSPDFKQYQLLNNKVNASEKAAKAATAAEADAKIKEDEAKAAEAVFAEAKAAAATAAADKGSMFSGFTNMVNKGAESVKGGLNTGTQILKRMATPSMATTLPLTEENFKDQIKKMKEDFSKILIKFNMTTLDIDCLIKGGYVTISKYTWVSKRKQYQRRDGSYGTHTDWVQEWSNFDTDNFYKDLKLDKFDDLQTKDITLKTFWTNLGEYTQSDLKLRLTLDNSKLEKIDIKTVCPPAQ